VRRLWVLLVVCGVAGADEGAEAPTTNLGTVLYLPLVEGHAQPKLFFPLVGYVEPGKAGVGSPYSNCAHILALGATWYQDWGPWPPQCDLDSRALAMVWSWHRPEDVGELDLEDLLATLPEVPDYAWGIQLANEPNLPQQAGMTVAETAELSWLAGQKWPGRTLISPATYNDLDYMVAVYDEHVRRFGVAPAWDLLAAHCYFETAAGCIRYVEGLLEFGKRWTSPLRVIVTEWAILPCSITTMGVRGQPDLARAQAEARRLRAYFEGHPDIVAHLWFASEYMGTEWCVWQPHPACDTALMRDGRLTAWGEWWLR